MPEKIAFVGKMHSGKGEAASYLERYREFQKLAFADPVKEASVVAMNAILEYLGDGRRINRSDLERDKSQLRMMPQFIGTNLGRQWMGNDRIWIERLLKRVDTAVYYDIDVVVDDCRFPNEAEALRDAGFKIVKVERPEGVRLQSLLASLVKSNPTGGIDFYLNKIKEMTSHPSETEVDSIREDAILFNNGSIVDLHDSLSDLCDRMFLESA